MADELNTPGHRWYQRRYNIPLANEDFSKQWIFDSGIQKIDAYIALLGGVSAYAILTYEPSYVTDFGAEFYRKSGATSTFSDSITHSASSNATMVDSDGLLKWRPHNLLLRSEEFDNAVWTKAGGWLVDAVTGYPDPDGGNTADAVIPSAGTSLPYTLQTVNVSGAKHTFSFYIKNGDAGVQWVRCIDASESNSSVWFDIVNGQVGTAQSNISSPTITEASGSFWKVEFSVLNFDANAEVAIAWASADGNSASTRVWSGTEVAFYLWGAHLYRSDLGGMVNNPDRGDSYVPTTTSAVYLPRRGHHVYNGDSWVNKGLLHESEARTNLVTYSDEFDNPYWLKVGGTITANNAVSPDGTTNADGFFEAAVTGAHQIYKSDVAVGVSGLYSFSVFLKAGGREEVSLYAFNANGSGLARNYYNLSTGAEVAAPTVTGSNISIVGNSVESFGNGWFKVSLQVNLTASGNLHVGINTYNSGVSFLGDITKGIYIYGAQLEAGSTPSSYIPNAGATSGVTRGAETLTVPAANLPWPSPVVIGEELVTNGTFDTDTTGWSGARGNETLSVVSGRLRSTAIAAGAHGPVQTLTGLTVGNVYQLFASVYTDGGAEANYFRVSTVSTLGADTVDLYSSVSADWERAFVATATTMYVGVIHVASAANEYVEIDNISVKEINPLSVSIQMQGEMTYADDDISANIVQSIRWQIDTSNRIAHWFSVVGSHTGKPRFIQSQGGITDIVEGSDTSYSPGVNVPFNIASRHGSTFINGAVDGTALTADTTPVALPDLSATDLQLGYDYMGTISLFRVWADDLTDAGIAEASAPSTVPSLSLTFDGASTSFTDTGMTV